MLARMTRALAAMTGVAARSETPATDLSKAAFARSLHPDCFIAANMPLGPAGVKAPVHVASRRNPWQSPVVDVLCLTRYDAAGASSRYRFYQFFPFLRAAGIRIDEGPLLGREYLDALYQRGERPAKVMARSAWRRLRSLASARSYDLLWVEKEVLPWFPSALEQLAIPSRVPTVLDFDDAIFHQYDQHRSWLVRRLLGRKIDRGMAAASVVVAGNEYLAARARGAGAEVQIIPTVVDLARYPAGPVPPGRPFTLGWIGSPATQGYLRDLAPTLAAFCRETGSRVLAVGPDPAFGLPGVPLEVVPWSAEREQGALQEFDVGLMPLPDTPWARGKCGFKLIQYMAGGRPTIAAPVGTNREIVVQGETGFLASTPAEWRSALHALRESPYLRHRMGLAGRERVARLYSLEAAAPRLAEVLTSAGRGR